MSAGKLGKCGVWGELDMALTCSDYGAVSLPTPTGSEGLVCITKTQQSSGQDGLRGGVLGAEDLSSNP